MGPGPKPEHGVLSARDLVQNEDMSEVETFPYTVVEIRSYLPSGWNLVAPDDPGTWDAGKEQWICRVIDGADTTWDLPILAAELKKMGRVDALKKAVDRLYRKALGRPWWAFTAGSDSD
jgi:hypothetical protein